MRLWSLASSPSRGKLSAGARERYSLSVRSLALGILLLTAAPARADEPPLRVVIISEDGLRPDVLDEKLTPAHVSVMRSGATARAAQTIPESDTLPSHAAMLSGCGTSAHGLWWNSYQPTRGFIHVP